MEATNEKLQDFYFGIMYLLDIIRKFLQVSFNTGNAEPLGIKNATCLRGKENTAQYFLARKNRRRFARSPLEPSQNDV